MFVMYYIYGVSVPSLLIESTNSMIQGVKFITCYYCPFIREKVISRHLGIFQVLGTTVICILPVATFHRCNGDAVSINVGWCINCNSLNCCL